MNASLTLEATVLELSLGKPPGFYFINSPGERSYCYDATGLDGFEALTPGQRVKIRGRWSPILKGVFEGERVVPLEHDPA